MRIRVLSRDDLLSVSRGKPKKSSSDKSLSRELLDHINNYDYQPIRSIYPQISESELLEVDRSLAGKGLHKKLRSRWYDFRLQGFLNLPQVELDWMIPDTLNFSAIDQANGVDRRPVALRISSETERLLNIAAEHYSGKFGTPLANTKNFIVRLPFEYELLWSRLETSED